MLSIFVADILPIFIIAGAGYILARRLDVPVKPVAHVVFYVLVPCLIFNLLLRSHLTGEQVGRMVGFSILVSASMGIIGLASARLLGLPRPDLIAFLLVVMISNTGNYGLTAVLFAFGPEALAHASVFFVTSSVITNTVGVFIAASGRSSIKGALLRITRAPVVYAVVAAIVVALLKRPLPEALSRPVQMLGDASLPVMVLTLGMQFERAHRPKHWLPVTAAVVISLIIAPLIALGLAELLGITGAARQAAVLLSSTPVAVMTTILAVEFEVAPAFVTTTVFLSTLLSPLTITPLIAYLKLG